MNNVNLELIWLALSHVLLFVALLGAMIQSKRVYHFSKGCWISVIICLIAPSLMLLIIPYCEYRSVRKQSPSFQELRKERHKLVNASILFAVYCLLFLIFNISMSSTSANNPWSSEMAYVHTNFVLLIFVLYHSILRAIKRKNQGTSLM